MRRLEPHQIYGSLLGDMQSSGAIGGKASLDLEASSTQYAAIADASQSGALDVASTITAECWVKFEALPSAGNSQTFLSKWQTSGNNQSYWFWLTNTAGFYTLKAAVTGDGASLHFAESGAIAVSNGTWYHFAFSWDPAAGTTPADEFEFYFNGSALTVGTLGDSDPATLFNSAAAFAVGAVDVNTLTLDGKIYDVRLWNDIRTPTEINDNKALNISPASANLVGIWFKDASPRDWTSNGNTLTLVNTPVYSADVPY